MTELLIERALPAHALEPVGDGWTVYGRAVPYDVEQEVSDDGVHRYLEVFDRSAFDRDAAAGGRWVNLFEGHSGDTGDGFLGRCVELTSADDGLYAAFRINREHPRAEEARAGELKGWSVSAYVRRSRVERTPRGERRTRLACLLRHVAATASPQYAGAGVLVAREHIIEGPVGTPRRDALKAHQRDLLDAVRGAR